MLFCFNTITQIFNVELFYLSVGNAFAFTPYKLSHHTISSEICLHTTSHLFLIKKKSPMRVLQNANSEDKPFYKENTKF